MKKSQSTIKNGYVFYTKFTTVSTVEIGKEEKLAIRLPR